MSSAIEPGTPVTIHATKQGMCAETGKVVSYSLLTDSYVIDVNRHGVEPLEIKADYVEVIE